MLALAKRRRKRRGAIFILALAVSLVVAAVGLSMVATMRAQQRASTAIAERLQAELLARSAVDWGRLLIEDDDDWRTNRSNGVWETLTSDQSTIQVSVVDPSDANLADNPMESVVITGTADHGGTHQRAQVTLYAELVPLDSLRTAMHAAGNIDIGFSRTVTISGALLSSNGNVSNSGILVGSVECNDYYGTGSVTGTTSENAEAKLNPDSTVFNDYKAMATTIPYSSTMQKFVLSTGRNPWGATNPNGIYYVNTGGNDVTLEKCRINGTIVVECGASRKVILKDAAFLHTASADYPVLITDGGIEFRLKSTTQTLSESTEGTNFNPTGAPYSGSVDSDTSDIYPNEIRGLVHAKGAITFTDPTKIVGGLITEKTGTAITFNASPEIQYDATLSTNPPIGYRTYQMRVQADSWKRAVETTVLGAP